jgi:hypothetical protein
MNMKANEVHKNINYAFWKYVYSNFEYTFPLFY